MGGEDTVLLQGKEYKIVEEIPLSRIEEVAKVVGLEPLPPIKGYYLEGREDPGLFHPEGEESPWWLVAIDRRDKRIGRSLLKHELTHIKLGHWEGSSNPADYTYMELEETLEEGGRRHLSIDIASVLSTVVKQFSLPVKKASGIVRSSAKRLGYPDYIISRGLELGGRYLRDTR